LLLLRSDRMLLLLREVTKIRTLNTIEDGRIRSNYSQTLDRGLQILELLAKNPVGLTVTEISKLLGINRVIVSRLLATLDLHRLVLRDENLRYAVAPGVYRLVSTKDASIQEVVGPMLVSMAEECGATAHMAQAHKDWVIVVNIAEPRGASVHISYPIGTSHRIDVGSDGLAILACRAPVKGERSEVAVARRRGYAVSFGEVLSPGSIGVSTSLNLSNKWRETAVGVTIFHKECVSEVGAIVVRWAKEMRDRIEAMDPIYGRAMAIVDYNNSGGRNQ